MVHSFATPAIAAFLAATAPPLGDAPPDPAKSSAAVAALREALCAQPAAPPAELAERPFARVPLTRKDAATAREFLWKAHADRLVAERSHEIERRAIKDGGRELRFFLKTFGERPESGHSLWISLHGGGNATKRVNDQQWENQKRLYSLDEGIYIAPRAPTDTWNLWHEAHVDRLFGRLVEDLIAIERIDPDRVYVLGYSAGGDGVYQLAPRMADRWAGAAMMAGHPNDASPLGLRNVAFALQVGGLDAAYNRNGIAREWGEKLDQLRKDDPGGYDHLVKIYAEKAHWMDREDAAALPWMARHRRHPAPGRVVWKQSSVVHDELYWLAVPPGAAKAGALAIAERKGQAIEIAKAEDVDSLLVRLDDRLVNLDEPVRITRGDRTLFSGVPPRTIATLLRTLAGRGDPRLMFEAEVAVDLTVPAKPEADPER